MISLSIFFLERGQTFYDLERIWKDGKEISVDEL